MASTLRIAQGDITTFKGDVIVNAANETLRGGGGVDGSIHRAAGPQLTEVCKALGGCVPGSAVMTEAFALPVAAIIHAVGPKWRGGRKNEATLLASAYTESLRLAEQAGHQKIAFPCISCGIYKYPVTQAATVAIGAIRAYFKNTKHSFDVTVMCFEDRSYRAFVQEAM